VQEGEIGSIRAAIDWMAHKQGEAVFLISPETGRALTFADLRKQSLALWARLHGAGLERGDKVALLMDNGLFAVQLFLGTMYAGLVSVPLNVRAGAAQLAAMLDHCDAQAIFVEDQYKAIADEALSGIGRAPRVIAADIDSFADAAACPFAGPAPAAPTGEDPALLMYSSGTVGEPKAAIHSHRTLLAHGRNSILSHELSGADRSLLVLPLYHINAECVTLIPALLSGGSVVVPHQFSVSRFWEWLDDYRCTWSAVVPTIIAQLLDRDDLGPERRRSLRERVRFLRSSSAPLSSTLHREFLDKFDLLLIQAMGSTETGNIFSNPLPPGENKIGSPGLAWGFETRIIDRDGADVPAGEPGEMLVRGPAVMQGYYKGAAATAAVLDPDGWLHTGDLAYQDRDGYFFIVGRVKELIIKGGVNIAPRQIDAVLEAHPAVLEAAAVGVPDRYLGEDVVAFAVLRSGIEGNERAILAFCESRLGHFKTPTRIHFVSDLPKGPSGKVQRLHLLDQAVRLAAAGPLYGNIAGEQDAQPHPASAFAQTIAESWKELLGQEQIDPDRNFFSLGGHSLMAIRCLSKLRDKLPVALSLSDFFENPTVAQQAALVSRRLGKPDDTGDRSRDNQTSPPGIEQPLRRQPIAPRAPASPYPLSPGQQRIWFFGELAPEVPLYNEAEAVRLIGELDVDAMQQALDAVVARHEALRTTMRRTQEGVMASVHDSWPLKIKLIDLSGLSAEQRGAEVGRLLIDEPRRLFDLESEPGIRATLLRLGAREHIFILMMHHIICDRWSTGVVSRELTALYQAFVCGEPAVLPALPIQYGDYVVWRLQRTEADFAEDLAFWEDNLRGAPELLQLPADRPRPRLRSYQGARRRFRLDPALAARLRDCSRQEQTSLFNILTAALNVLLYRYTGSEDLVLGIPIADRERHEVQSLVGFLIDTQALRTRLSGSMTFRELLARVRSGLVDLYSHREIPFDRVVSRIRSGRDLSHSPIFQVMINCRDRDMQLMFSGLPGMAVESLLPHTKTSQFDMTFYPFDSGEDVWLEVEYNTDLFDEQRITRMVCHYQTLLKAAAADPDQHLAKLPLLTEAERRELVDWSGTEAAYPKDRCLHELFEEQAARGPDAVAVVFEGDRLTYRQLNERANQLAHRLRELGVKSGDLVGIFLERSLEMVVGVVGILKAGGAYVPLDPAYPQERLAFMMEDAHVEIVVTQNALRQRLPASEARFLCLDGDAEVIAQHGRENLQSAATPDHRAYVIYTSGSTGKPKGVVITHYNVVRLFQSTEQWFGFDRHDIWTLFHSYAFDFSVFEMWGALLYGGRLVVVPYLVSRSPGLLYELLNRERVTVLCQTPSAFLPLMAHDAETTRPKELMLRLVIFGGEALEFGTLAPWFERHGDQRPRLVNMYGITETTVHVTYRPVTSTDAAAGGSRIGVPLPDLQIHILDEQLQPVPIGVPGEMYVGGAGLAQGYLNRPELTAHRFIVNPFSETANARLYRSGDLARYLWNGEIEYLGRIDHQVKLRGFRIELGEIEASLRLHSGVDQCVVLVREDAPGDKQLVAYIVPSDQQGPGPRFDELRDFLKQKLPEYMVPAAFVALDRLPLTANGKIDRSALPAPERGRTSLETGHVAPRTLMEAAVAQIWSRVLGLTRLGVHVNFFDLGGHSLRVLQLLVEAKKSLNYELPLPVFYQNPTIAGMAKAIEEEKQFKQEPVFISLKAGEAGMPVVIIQVGPMLFQLARRLNAGRPVFATFAPLPTDLSRQAMLNYTVEALAAPHLALLRTQLRSDRCVLVGYSFGGVLAFEIAHQLQRYGIAVETILLLDAPVKPMLWWQKLSPAEVRRRLHYKVVYALSRGRTLAAPPDAGSTDNLSSPELEEASYQFGLRWPREIFPVLRYTCAKYRFRPLNLSAVLFQPHALHTAYTARAWAQLFSRGLAVVNVPGDHHSMIQHPNVAVLANRVNQVLRQRQPPEVSQLEPHFGEDDEDQTAGGVEVVDREPVVQPMPAD
jgi:amino acid adenylation domain-containing protein